MPIVNRVWKIDGKAAVQPELLLSDDVPRDWRGKANGIVVFRGIRPGVATFLMLKADCEAILKKTTVDIVFTEEEQNDRGKWKVNQTTTFKNWYPTRAYAATPAFEGSTATMVLELQDVRCVIESGATNLRFNMRSFASYILPTTNEGIPYSWTEVLQVLWGDLPTQAGPFPTMPYTPDSTPENLIFEGIQTVRAIAQVLAAIGLELVHDAFKGEFKFVRKTSTQSGLKETLERATKDGKLLWQYDAKPLPKINYPKKVDVSFTRATYSAVLGNVDVLSETVYADALDDTTYPIWDSMISLGTNGEEMQTRAEEIADAIKGFFRPGAEPYAATFGGVLKILPGEQITRVTWITDGQSGTITQLRHSQLDVSSLLWPARPARARELQPSLGATGPGGIPGRVGAAMGSGTVHLIGMDNDGNMVWQRDGNGDAVTDTAYNFSTDSVAPNTFIQMKRVDDNLVVDWEDCVTPGTAFTVLGTAPEA